MRMLEEEALAGETGREDSRGVGLIRPWQESGLLGVGTLLLALSSF